MKYRNLSTNLRHGIFSEIPNSIFSNNASNHVFGFLGAAPPSIQGAIKDAVSGRGNPNENQAYLKTSNDLRNSLSGPYNARHIRLVRQV